MELRMRPRSDAGQRCLEFELMIEPDAYVNSYADSLGNIVHHFDIPSEHHALSIKAESLVERHPVPKLPSHLSMETWKEVDRLAHETENWDWVHPSHFAQQTQKLKAFAEELQISRRTDPLTTMIELNGRLHRALKYEPKSTHANSLIDECLEQRCGVCQDFAHVFIAVSRLLHIPCRYVSGHLFHRPDEQALTARDASHAWAEVLLPELGWVGFDPTNGMPVDENHIRTAVGRDYLDVAPTRGVFKGVAESELTVKVAVTRVGQDGRS